MWILSRLKPYVVMAFTVWILFSFKNIIDKQDAGQILFHGIWLIFWVLLITDRDIGPAKSVLTGLERIISLACQIVALGASALIVLPEKYSSISLITWFGTATLLYLLIRVKAINKWYHFYTMMQLGATLAQDPGGTVERSWQLLDAEGRQYRVRDAVQYKGKMDSWEIKSLSIAVADASKGLSDSCITIEGYPDGTNKVTRPVHPRELGLKWTLVIRRIIGEREDDEGREEKGSVG